MPGQQDVELLGRLVGYPVADTLEHLERVWARDEPRGERGALGSDRRITVAPHVQSRNCDHGAQRPRTGEHHRSIPAERAVGGVAVASAHGIASGRSLSLIHISEPTRRTPISYAVFCLKKKKK